MRPFSLSVRVIPFRLAVVTLGTKNPWLEPGDTNSRTAFELGELVLIPTELSWVKAVPEHNNSAMPK